MSPNETPAPNPAHQDPPRDLQHGKISPRNYEDPPGQSVKEAYDPEEQSDPIDQRAH